MHVKTIHFPQGNQDSAAVSPKGLSGVSCGPLSENVRLDLSDIDTCHPFVPPPKVTFLNRSGWELLAGNLGLGEASHHDTE